MTSHVRLLSFRAQTACGNDHFNIARFHHVPKSLACGNPNALQVLFKSQADQEAQFETELETISTRLATVFGALREMPVIRYQGAKEQGKESTSARSRHTPCSSCLPPLRRQS
ncbi:Sec1-like domain containing protein [Cymbomonas tetramitiformis]|uniref:Sec1-like domain containing protein n=1 Tax=Cymbomonas tetramitiformis TaxID=36881 RepID=A0AAE0GJB7_9CHLO|nr:Sec1-like domain containing protein [Cymbomonas tetramitiformis]